MSSLIKRKLDNLISNPVAKIFKKKVNIQDTEAGNALIAYYQLLMILAYADNTVSDKEINILKNYFYGSGFGEKEWRKIDLFRINKPTKEEIKAILDNVLQEIHKSKDKSEFIDALKEIINADGIVKDEENEMLALLKNEITSVPVFNFKRIILRIQDKLGTKNDIMLCDEDSEDYSKNPIAPILKDLLDANKFGNMEVLSAKIGLAFVVIHSDMSFDVKEKLELKDFIKKECKIGDDEADKVMSKLLQIPENYFEIAYLARVLTGLTDETERLELLIELFKIARADQVYDDFEDKYLRLIAQFLFISDGDFRTLRVG